MQNPEIEHGLSHVEYLRKSVFDDDGHNTIDIVRLATHSKSHEAAQRMPAYYQPLLANIGPSKQIVQRCAGVHVQTYQSHRQHFFPLYNNTISIDSVVRCYYICRNTNLEMESETNTKICSKTTAEQWSV